MTETERHSPNKIYVVTDITLGDGGKGPTVDWLTKQTKAFMDIRSGGCQAGHHVKKSDGREQEFSQFGSGTFEGAKTHLKQMVISPTDFFQEAMELEKQDVNDPFSIITIDKDCLTITPFHGAFGRFREISRGKNRKGTVGMGVGEAVEDSKTNPELAIKAGDFLLGEENLTGKVEAVRQFQLQKARELLAVTAGLAELTEAQKELSVLENESLVPLVVQSFIYLARLVKIVDEEYLKEVLAQEGAIVCEASQGVLLHPRSGFIPHVTQVDPSSQDILATLNRLKPADREVIRLGICRSHLIRHGPGPFPSFSRKMTDEIPEPDNSNPNPWRGEFRKGYYDTVLLQYAINTSGGKESYDGLMISFLDVLANRQEWPVVESYTYEGNPPPDLDRYFELKDGKIVGIKVHPDAGKQAHLDHQRRLTELISQCKPVLTILRAEEGKSLERVFLDFVENKLAIPVVAVARGPKAEDREVRPGWEHLFGLAKI